MNVLKTIVIGIVDSIMTYVMGAIAAILILAAIHGPVMFIVWLALETAGYEERQ